MKKLRLGIIGISPGNGHPYSWSAIFNGYNPKIMENCGFPVIPRYLENQKFPNDCISNAEVTHIWTQNKKVSKHIADATNIKYVVNEYEDLISKVDAILLARDDSENHLKFATPFLNAGLPIYIDKPLALSIKSAKKILSLQKYSGQIFSCSALKFADELCLNKEQLSSVGKIKNIHGYISKDWDKYSIHIIEPIMKIISKNETIIKSQKWHNNGYSCLDLELSSHLNIKLETYGSGIIPMGIKIVGDKSFKDLFFKNTFQAFKNTLNEFILSITSKSNRIDEEQMLKVISWIEEGRK